MARYMSKKKLRKKRIRLRVAASLMDMLGIIGCVVLLVLCSLLLRSLVVWVTNDFEVSFATLKAAVLNAVVVTGR